MSPWTCRFNTATLTDGSYDFRAIVVDVAGNTRTSAVIAARSVNNLTASSVSVEDPGAYLSGTVTVQANAASPVGVVSVRIQRSGGGLNSWTDICTDTTSPYTCAFDTTTAATPLGLYDLRAVMTQTGGGTLTSALVTGRTIDNSAVRGVDVQAANVAGGTLGRMEQGDTLVLTYKSAMKASTLITGWTGTGPMSLSVRAADVANVESIALNSSGIVASGLGTVAPNGNYLVKNKIVTYASTATLSSAAGGGSVVTIVLGAPVGSGRQTQTMPATMRWTPSATATDLAGVASSVTPATESATADRDF